jgi:hypothetical protein
VLLAASNKSKQCGFGNLFLVGSLMFFEMTVSFCLGETVTKTSIKIDGGSAGYTVESR